MTNDQVDVPPVDQVPAPLDAASAPHVADAAPAHDGHAADHGEALGPVDTAQWAAGLIGVAVALAVAACFVLATQGLGAY